MGEYRGQTMRVQPVKMQADAGEVTVRNLYLRPGSPQLTVDYAMRKTAQGWKIYDITVEGISLVIAFRSEFQQIVGQSGIDGLIKTMAEKNQPASMEGNALLPSFGGGPTPPV